MADATLERSPFLAACRLARHKKTTPQGLAARVAMPDTAARSPKTGSPPPDAQRTFRAVAGAWRAHTNLRQHSPRDVWSIRQMAASGLSDVSGRAPPQDLRSGGRRRAHASPVRGRRQLARVRRLGHLVGELDVLLRQ